LVDSSSIIVCCGSGGVGKTTTAAALAIEAARRGRRVVVITIDPARRLADALGLTDGLGNDPRRIESGGTGELSAMMLDATQTFDDVVREHSRSSEQAKRILDNPFYKNVASRLSGSQEYMAAEKLYALDRDERFDLVVVDTPPSREALDFLRAPRKLTNFLDHRVYRWLMAPARGGLRVLNIAAQPILRTIGRVIGADVLADAIDFFQAFEGIEEGFRNRAVAVEDLLRSDRTHYVVVASPRSDTIEEATFFIGELARLSISVSGLVVNRLQPRFGSGTSAATMRASKAAEESGDHPNAILLRNLAELRKVAEAEEKAIAPLLTAAKGASIARLHLRADDVHDLSSIAGLGQDLLAEQR
jgi:anion-transporting  ArsA/GET3 family ATPase